MYNTYMYNTYMYVGKIHDNSMQKDAVKVSTSNEITTHLSDQALDMVLRLFKALSIARCLNVQRSYAVKLL